RSWQRDWAARSFRVAGLRRPPLRSSDPDPRHRTPTALRREPGLRGLLIAAPLRLPRTASRADRESMASLRRRALLRGRRADRLWRRLRARRALRGSLDAPGAQEKRLRRDCRDPPFD